MLNFQLDTKRTTTALHRASYREDCQRKVSPLSKNTEFLIAIINGNLKQILSLLRKLKHNSSIFFCLKICNL